MDDLAKKALSGLFLFLLVFALLLFLPAGTLRFWEAWVYWPLFSGFVLFITLYFLKRDPALIERRMDAGPGAERETSQKRIQTAAGVLVCALYIVPGLDHRFHWSSVPLPAVLAADGATALGMFLTFRVFQENRYAASTVRVETGQPVISTGPYAWVRHPMYTGSVLGFLAAPFALGSLWALIPALLLSGVVVVRLLDEERYLSQNLPGYDDYRQSVRYRLVPFVW